jgi:hypothetical protein
MNGEAFVSFEYGIMLDKIFLRNMSGWGVIYRFGYGKALELNITGSEALQKNKQGNFLST